MGEQINPDRFRRAMAEKGVAAKELVRAVKSQRQDISERTISRYRSGTEPHGVRSRLLLALAAALEVDPGYLAGTMEEPAKEDADPPALAMLTKWQIRLPSRIRNAYSLVALRYEVPASCIIAMAPLLFELFARDSLVARSETLATLRSAYEARLSQENEAPYLPRRAFADSSADAIYAAEEHSIAQRDLFGERLWDAPMLQHESFDDDFTEETGNPLAAHLQRKIRDLGASAQVAGVSAARADYEVCMELATSMACGDEDLAEAILDGSILIHDLPRNLWPAEMGEARVEWLQAKWTEHLARFQAELPNFDLDFGVADGARS